MKETILAVLGFWVFLIILALGHQYAEDILDGTANGIVNTLIGWFFLVIEFFVGLFCIAICGGGDVGYSTGPRGGEYRMSASGKSKVYITKS